MANGFKIADAYADFHIDVDSEIGRAAGRLKAKGAEFAKMGENAGKAFSAGFGRGVDLDQSLAKNVESLRTRTNQLERMGNQAGEGYGRGFRTGVNLRSAMVEQIAVVKSSRVAFANEGKQAGQAYSRGFGGSKLAGPSVGSASGAEASGEQAAAATARGFERGSKDIDNATTKVAQRNQAKFSAILYAGLSLGAPALAAAGALAVTASLGAVAGGFAAFAVSALRGTDEVADHWGRMSQMVINDSKAIAAPLKGDVVAAIDDMGKAWVRLRPEVATATMASAAAVHELTGAATDFAEQAMPGVVTATKASLPVLQGLRTFSGQAATGLSDLFTNASKGSEGAKQGVTIFGGTVQTLEGRLGSLFANAANGSSGPLRSLDVIVDQLSGSLLDVTASGSGTMGMLQGFSTAGSGTVTVLHGLLSAAAALPPQVTQLAGAWGAASFMASKFGIDAGKGFEGYGDKVKSATGITGKLSAATTGLVAGAINPAFLAVTALGVGLDMLGAAQENAAMYTSRHRDNVRTLTQAIREDNGALGDHVKIANVDALQSKNAAANLAVFGSNLGDAKLAIEGNSAAYDRMNYSARASLATIGEHAQLSQDDINALKDLGTTSLKTGQSYDELSRAGGRGAEIAAMLGGTWHDQIAAITNGTGAVGEQIKAQKEAHDAYLLSQSALTGLGAAQIEARDATVAHTQAVRDSVGADLDYRGSVQGTKKAIEDLAKTNKDHKATEDDKTNALLAAEQAMQKQITAAGQAAAATLATKSPNEQAAAATAAMNVETVKLANSWAGQLPASLQAGIGKMSISEAKAAGLTVAIDNTGQAVYRLPDGKNIKITGSGVQEVQDEINGLIRNNDGKVIRLRVTTTGGGSAYIGVGTGGRGSLMAEGGLLKPGAQRKQSVAMFAGGGLASLNPMAARATVVPANTWRIVGDNMQHPESYIPWDGSTQSRATLAETNKAFGIDPTGMLAATKEALAAANAGRAQEDLSVIGGSANLDHYNDRLASLYYGQTHANFGVGPGPQADMARWLQSYVAQQTSALQSLPSAVASALGAMPPSAQVTVTPPATMDYELLAAIVARKIFLKGR